MGMLAVRFYAVPDGDRWVMGDAVHEGKPLHEDDGHNHRAP